MKSKLLLVLLGMGTVFGSCSSKHGSAELAKRQNRAGTEKLESQAKPSSESTLPLKERQKYYTISLEPDTIPVGRKTIVTLSIVPSRGWKWNKEFPAKLKVSNTSGLDVQESEFSKKSGIVVQEAEATIPIQISAPKVGLYHLELSGSFSVCNEKLCKIFRDVRLKFEIQARQ